MKKLAAWLKKHYLPVSIAVVSLLLFVVGMFNAHMHKSYNSDDVGQQVMLKDVQLNEEPAIEGRQQYYGSDSFIIKFPLYWLANQFEYGSRASVFATSFVLTLIGLALFLLSAWWLHKFFVSKTQKPDWRFAALLWPWCLGLFFFILFVNPNLRNIELGLSFAIVAGLFYWLVEKRDTWVRNRSRAFNIVMGSLAAIFIGLFYYSDPYIEYVLFVPLLLFIGFKMVRNWATYRSYLPVVGVLVGSLVASVIIRSTLNHFGFMSHNAPTIFADVTKIPDHIMLSIQGLLPLFNIDFFGRPVFSAGSIMRLLFVLPLLALLLAYRDKGVRDSLKNNFWHQFLLLQIAFTLAVFIFSQNPVDLSTTRYFVILPLSVALLSLVVAYAYSNRKIATRVIVGLALLLVPIGLFNNAKDAYSAYKTDTIEVTSQPIPVQTQSTAGQGNTRNKINKQIAKVAIENNLHKGYAAFWSGPINTFFSENKVKFQPVSCNTQNEVAPYNWMLDTQTLHAPATETFFLYNQDTDMSSSDAWCGGETHLLKQFGKPKKTIPVSDTIRFYVYDYDILNNMKAAD